MYQIKVRYYPHCVCVCVNLFQLRPTVFDPMDCCLPGSSVHGILQARKLEWIAMPCSRGSSLLRDPTHGPLDLGRRWQAGSLPLVPPGKPFSPLKVKVTQSCPTVLRSHGTVVHGILQARILEWIAFPFSRWSFQPRDWTQVSCIAGRFFTSWAP